MCLSGLPTLVCWTPICLINQSNKKSKPCVSDYPLTWQAVVQISRDSMFLSFLLNVTPAVSRSKELDMYELYLTGTTTQLGRGGGILPCRRQTLLMCVCVCVHVCVICFPQSSEGVIKVTPPLAIQFVDMDSGRWPTLTSAEANRESTSQN